MKILHVSRTMGQGGAEKIVFQLCVDNDRNEQFVISNGGAYVKKLKKRGISHYFMPDLDSKNPIKMLRCFWDILVVVLKEKIDVIHTHHRMAAFYAKIIMTITGKKTIYTAHNVFANKKYLTRFALNNIRLVAVGEGVRNNLVNFFGLRDEQITTIFNSIKIELKGYGAPELEKAEKKERIFVGTIGRLSEQKGIDLFIRAIGNVRINYPNIMGVVVGDGEKKGELESLVKKQNLENHILFLGYRDNVLDIIKQLQFVVLASRWEGLPLTPIETFSQKKTIIASNIAGNNEIVKSGINGLLFQMNSVTELAKCMEKLISNKKMLTELENNAFNDYTEKFSYVMFVEKYKEVYETL